MTSSEAIRLIEDAGNKVTSDILKDLITNHFQTKSDLQESYRYYLGEVPITERRFDDENKINNKIANDYIGDIVDGIVGYMFGEPISYTVDEEDYSEVEINKINEAIKFFKKRNSLEDLDSTTGEMLSITGQAYRLLYIDTEGKERIMDVKPWEAIVINDATLDEPTYGMIYYDVEVKEGKKTKTRTRVEWYDKKYIYYYITQDDGDFILDNSYSMNPQPHLFDGVPLIKFINNNAMISDFKKVTELINSYDRTISDIQNEIEEFRIAYLGFYGVEPDEEVIAKAKQVGGLFFPEGTDAKFITKNLDTAVNFIENHKKTLNENIYKFSKSVDMRDEGFSGGNASGESRKWKLVALENRAINKERKFTKSLQRQFKLLASAWAIKEIKFNSEDLVIQYKRNLPIDLQYHATATATFKGNISEKKRLSLLPFVEDVEAELQEMEDENEGLIDFSEPEIEEEQENDEEANQ